MSQSAPMCAPNMVSSSNMPLSRRLAHLNNIHPFEVDSMHKNRMVCDSIDVRRKTVMACADKTSDVCAPPRPGAFYYDGRCMNQFKEQKFLEDPCKYWRNKQNWKPKAPQVYLPQPGHYNGLGKPPKQCFRLRKMKVLGNRSMPSYQLYSDETRWRESQKDAVKKWWKPC